MGDEQAITRYVADIRSQFESDHAREHAYRPALKELMSSFDDVRAVNDPKRSEHGNPDFVFLKDSNRDIILGYAEAKDITIDLDKTAKTEQLHRYAGYNKLFLTNYLDFRFYRNGEEYERISIGKLRGQNVYFDINDFVRLTNELKAFLELPPEPIKSGKSLALIMGQKARRIRDSISHFLGVGSDRNQELERIYHMMKELLVHDLSHEKFADMYAQTLVYGLFAARYNDSTPNNFSRREASELVPASNPFLREFFAHIGGIHFDKRLAHIVDELCDVFAVSDVHLLVQKHLRLFEVENEKDPIIHFYEDFLKEYDPAERKRMGAYYTPVPVVRFIIREVDRILKEDFGLAKGLADTSKIVKEIDTGQDLRHDRRRKLVTTQKREYHRIQVLDPAVGTATFLNEIIKFIAKDFEGQEGRWPAYVESDLLPRLSGFELMMAPYTIAHLKLEMTLEETGVKDLKQRLGVYLTNTLEEGIPSQQDLFSIGLAAAVTEESQAASEIKHDRPIMVVIGNPPYSVSSNNKSEFAKQLVKPYKQDLNERKINLDDDYIKFIAFAESMIAKNGEGIVAMITNNSYIDGITHRQMRKHLLETFDKIYILDLHGSSVRKETAPDGGKDENVFDIMQGVSIVLMVKIDKKPPEKLGEVQFAEIFGKRKKKFLQLGRGVDFKTLSATAPNHFFALKNLEQQSEYDTFVIVPSLFLVQNSGIKTDRDELFIDFDADKLATRIKKLLNKDYDPEFIRKFRVFDSGSYKLTAKIRNKEFDRSNIKSIDYRPFDTRKIYYDPTIISRPAKKIATQGRADNTYFSLKRQSKFGFSYSFLHQNPAESCLFESAYANNTEFPLYIYHGDGTRTANFDLKVLKEFTKNLTRNYEPEDILDYIYAVLHSPKYREKYKEFLKIDFPRVPAPADDTEFTRLVGFGRQLRDLHLMKSPVLESYETTFPEPGTNEVEQVRYEAGKVWINDTQYFGNVSEVAWYFYIGGYQPAQKWLKDRKGRTLTNEDLEHYQKIIKILIETQKLMDQIDATQKLDLG